MKLKFNPLTRAQAKRDARKRLRGYLSLALAALAAPRLSRGRAEDSEAFEMKILGLRV